MMAMMAICMIQVKTYTNSIKGGQFMHEKAKLCVVTCSDGSTYALEACVRGHLIEVNKNLAQDPTLLTRKVNHRPLLKWQLSA